MMLQLRRQTSSRTTAAEAVAMVAPVTTVPTWVTTWLGLPASRTARDIGIAHVVTTTGAGATLVTAAVDVETDGDAVERATLAAYRAAGEAIASSPHPHAVRIWNWVPGIHAPAGPDRDRYMAFNAGRCAAFSEWFGSAGAIAGRTCAASGVGYDGGAIVVHVLAAAEAGASVENPLQVPAYRYSKRYGPIPPCFARATRVRSPRPALLVAGTAAITGEQSRHAGDLARQFELTCANLRALIRAGNETGNKPFDPLSTMRHVRIYVTRTTDVPAVEGSARAAFTGASDVEFLRADLCRSDLLVEIEGVAYTTE